MKRIIALIPARERSVRIKNKNLKKICKQPLIWWTSVSYTHLRAHETLMNLVCRLLLGKNFFF